MDQITPEQFAADHITEALRQHAAGAQSRTLAHQGNPAHRKANLAEATEKFAASDTAYTIARLTRALAEHAPEAAEAVIADIDFTVAKGYAPEWAYSQAIEHGMDPEAILRQARKSL